MATSSWRSIDRTTDMELAARAAAGDPAARETVVRSMGELVLMQAINSTWRHPADREDYAQEGMIACLRPQTLRNYSGRGPLVHFLQAVSSRRMIDLTRQETSRRRREETSPWLAPDPAEPADGRIDSLGLADALREALSQEPPFIELIASLKAQGRTNAEIALQLNCSMGRVKAAWHRAQRRLRARLNGWDPNG